jgi:2-methylisocitrate lyase-like PEP mutase family enzyme
MGKQRKVELRDLPGSLPPTDISCSACPLDDHNARLFARKLCDRGAAQVCSEDKIFPKLNSFLGEDHDFVEAPEFCDRLRAIKDNVADSDFVIVARTEALIGTERST